MSPTSPGMRIAGAACLAVLAALAQVHANPNGPTVVAGTASFATSGSTFTVTNSNGTIINWQGFSIGAGETTRFSQSGATSAVLNRVTGSAGSSIMGTLTSNGNVFLVNPNGVLFGAGSQVSVGGLAVSTGDITNANFLAGNYAFSNAGAGSITIDGSLTVTGNLTLVSNGTITVGGPILTGGTVNLANSGQTPQVIGINTISGSTAFGAGTTNVNSTVTLAIVDFGRFGSTAGLVNLVGTNNAITGGGTLNLTTTSASNTPAGFLALTNPPGSAGGVAAASARPASQASMSLPVGTADAVRSAIGGPVLLQSVAFNLEKRDPAF